MSGQTEGDLHTNRFGTTWFTMNMSVGRTLMNKMLTIKLAATDVFNTTNSNRTMNTFGVFTNQQKSNSVRGISLNAIYRFQPHKSKYKGGAANEAELKRL